MTTVAIILPAYNEAQTLADTMRAFHAAMPEAHLYVINNRSSDATEQIARDTLAMLGCAGRVINEQRPGKGCALRRAFLDIEADVFVIADADLTYPADQIHALVAPVLAGDVDMVVGDRHSNGRYAMENKRPLHNFGNNLVKTLVNRLFRANLADIMSGYRAFSRRFVKTYPILVEGFEIETDMTLHALDKRFRIVEIPVAYRDRPAGSTSKLNTFRDGARVIFTIAQILRYYRPLLFFGGAAVVFAAGSLLAALPVFQDWFREQYIHHVPMAILATGLAVVSVLMLSIGLVLDSVSHQAKQNFELGLHASRRSPPRRE